MDYRKTIARPASVSVDRDARTVAEPPLDLVAAPTPNASPLKSAGRFASPLGAAGEEPGRFNIMAQPTPVNLGRLAELLDTGTLRLPG